MITLLHGDCLEKMAEIPDGSVDMVLADPPYGTTACQWDSIIPLEPMWEQLKRVIKPNGAIVLTASQPFTTKLIASNMDMFKYCWVWEKSNTSNPLNAPYQPLKVHEDIVVFSLSASTYSKRGSMKYNPQKTDSTYYKGGKRSGGKMVFHTDPSNYIYAGSDKRYPRSVLKVNEQKGKHPTQKPVALMEYMIKTYTNEGETVLDFTMGSGTTGVACLNTNRSFIGIEKNLSYFNLATDRIHTTQPPLLPHI